MTDEELAAIKHHTKSLEHLAEIQPVQAVAAEVWTAVRDATALLAEVESLRAANYQQSLYIDGLMSEQTKHKDEICALQAQNAALREIVQAVANASGGSTAALFLNVPRAEDGSIDPDYAMHLMLRARALLKESQQ